MASTVCVLRAGCGVRACVRACVCTLCRTPRPQVVLEFTRAVLLSEFCELKPGKKYAFAVRVRNNVGWSAWSPDSPPSATLTGLPERPDRPLMLGSGITRIELSVGKPENNGKIISRFVVQRRVLRAGGAKASERRLRRSFVVRRGIARSPSVAVRPPPNRFDGGRIDTRVRSSRVQPQSSLSDGAAPREKGKGVAPLIDPLASESASRQLEGEPN